MKISWWKYCFLQSCIFLHLRLLGGRLCFLWQPKMTVLYKRGVLCACSLVTGVVKAKPVPCFCCEEKGIELDRTQFPALG